MKVTHAKISPDNPTPDQRTNGVDWNAEHTIDFEGGDPIPFLKETKEFTFHEGATSISEGAVVQTEGYSTVTIEVTGTATSKTLVFEGSVFSGAFFTPDGVQLSVSPEIYQYDLTGLKQFRANLTAISDGNVTIKGILTA